MTDMNHEERLTALEIAIAWLITRNERDSFFVECRDLMEKENLPPHGSWGDYEVERHRRSFESIETYINYWVGTKTDPIVPTIEIDDQG